MAYLTIFKWIYLGFSLCGVVCGHYQQMYTVALPIIVHRYESRVTIIINVDYRYFVRLYGECKNNNNNNNKSGLVFSVAALAIQTAERLCMYVYSKQCM